MKYFTLYTSEVWGGKSVATWLPRWLKVFEESGSGRKFMDPSSALSPDQTIQW